MGQVCDTAIKMPVCVSPDFTLDFNTVQERQWVMAQRVSSLTPACDT